MLPRSRIALAGAAFAAACALVVGAPMRAAADTTPHNDWHIDHTWSDIGPMVGWSGLPSDTDQTVMFYDGVDHSTDGGATWTHASNPCFTQNIVSDPSPSQPDTLLAADCGSPQGVLYRSTDAGATWSQVQLSDPNLGGSTAQIDAVVFSSAAPYTAYAVACDPYPYTGASTVYSSSDGGATWTPHAAPGVACGPDFVFMAADPRDAQHLAFSGFTTSGGQHTLSVSHDGGATWVSSVVPWMYRLQFDPSDSNRLYAIGSGTLESTDDGATWSVPAGWPAGLQVVAAGGVLYVQSSTAIWQSTDGGTTWRSAALTVPTQAPSFDGLVVDPTDAKHLFVYDNDHLMTWSVEFDNSLPATSAFEVAEQNPASDLTPTSATLSASITPLWAGNDGFVQWNWEQLSGTHAAGSATQMFPVDPDFPASTLIPRLATHTVTGLLPNTTYNVTLAGGFNFPGGVLQLNRTPAIQFTTPPALAPHVTRAPQAVLAAGQVQSGSVPVTVSWASSAGTYAVGSSTVGRQLGSGAWSSAGQTAKSALATRVALGKSAQFRVQTGDGHGDLSTLTAGPKASVSFKDDAGTAATWAGSWKRTNNPSAVDKTLRTSASGPASVTLHFTGRSIAVIAPKGKHYAHFTATLDGKSKGTVATSASALAARHTIAVYSFASAGKHTLVLHVVRGSGHTLAALDGFVVLG